MKRGPYKTPDEVPSELSRPIEEVHEERGIDLKYDWFNTHVPYADVALTELFDSPAKILELGSFEGSSTSYWMDRFMSRHEYAKMWCVDTWGGSFEHHAHKDSTGSSYDMEAAEASFHKVIDAWGPEVRDRVTVMKMTTTEALLKLAQTHREYFSIVYVDASHDQIDVLNDMVLGWQLLAHTGIMIVDDMWHEEKIQSKRSEGRILCNAEWKAIMAFLSVYEHDVSLMTGGRRGNHKYKPNGQMWLGKRRSLNTKPYRMRMIEEHG